MNALHADDPRLAATLLKLQEFPESTRSRTACHWSRLLPDARQTRPRVLALHDLEGHPIAQLARASEPLLSVSAGAACRLAWRRRAAHSEFINAHARGEIRHCNAPRASRIVPGAFSVAAG